MVDSVCCQSNGGLPEWGLCYGMTSCLSDQLVIRKLLPEELNHPGTFERPDVLRSYSFLWLCSILNLAFSVSNYPLSSSLSMSCLLFSLNSHSLCWDYRVTHWPCSRAPWQQLLKQTTASLIFSFSKPLAISEPVTCSYRNLHTSLKETVKNSKGQFWLQ